LTQSSSNTLGRYQIIREIARSNDIVYEAIDPSIGRRIALKELQLPANLVGSARRERIERFYREAKAAGALTHPNIVTIYEVGEENGRHFIAMEFLEGQTLQDAIEIQGSLQPKQAVDVVGQVLDALDYAHSKGIIHRDIKPANIQLLPGGRVKLTDFGIARIMREPSITQSGQIFGTPSYMSPEQVTGKDIDPRSDLFSVGVVLYETLTGGKPFTGDSVVTITYNIMNTVPPRPAGVPDGLVDIAEKALEKDPGRRYQTASEFAEALRSDWQNAGNYGTLVGSVPPPIFFPPGQQQPQRGPLGPPVAVPPFGAPPGQAAPAPGIPPAGTPPYGGGPQPGQQYPYGGAPPAGGPASAPAPGLPPPALQPYPGHVRQGPFLSPGARQALTMLFVALLLGSLVLAAIWGVSNAWQNYQLRANDQRAAEYIQKGNSMQAARRYEEAVTQYRSALSIQLSRDTRRAVVRSITSCYVSLATDYLNDGNSQAAHNVLQQALTYSPDSGDALYTLGVCYAREGDWAHALDNWDQAVSRDPASQGGKQARASLARYYWDYAEASYQRGDTDSAVEYWRRVVGIDPGSDLAQAAQDRIDRVALTR